MAKEKVEALQTYIDKIAELRKLAEENTEETVESEDAEGTEDV